MFKVVGIDDYDENDIRFERERKAIKASRKFWLANNLSSHKKKELNLYNRLIIY